MAYRYTDREFAILYTKDTKRLNETVKSGNKSCLRRFFFHSLKHSEKQIECTGEGIPDFQPGFVR